VDFSLLQVKLIKAWTHLDINSLNNKVKLSSRKAPRPFMNDSYGLEGLFKNGCDQKKPGCLVNMYNLKIPCAEQNSPPKENYDLGRDMPTSQQVTAFLFLSINSWTTNQSQRQV
jgi:hypothetical protein